MMVEQTNTEAAAPITRLNVRYEQATCGRCAGSGHYSYCQMYGTTCFKCHGRKTVTTKKGLKAADTYEAIRKAVLSFRVERVVPGMVLWFDSEPGLPGVSRGLRAGWFRVLEVGTHTSQHRSGDGPCKMTHFVALTTKGRTVHVPVGGMVLRQPTAAALEMMAQHMVGVNGATVTVERGGAA
jgi:hypothetical protein